MQLRFIFIPTTPKNTYKSKNTFLLPKDCPVIMEKYHISRRLARESFTCRLRAFRNGSEETIATTGAWGALQQQGRVSCKTKAFEKTVFSACVCFSLV